MGDLTCVLHMSLHSQRNCLDAQQDQKGANRRENRSCRALIDAPRSGDERLPTKPAGVNEPVIGLVRLANMGYRDAETSRPEATIAPPITTP